MRLAPWLLPRVPGLEPARPAHPAAAPREPPRLPRPWPRPRRPRRRSGRSRASARRGLDGRILPPRPRSLGGLAQGAGPGADRPAARAARARARRSGRGSVERRSLCGEDANRGSADSRSARAMARSGPTSIAASHRTTPAQGWLTSPGSRRYQLWRRSAPPCRRRACVARASERRSRHGGAWQIADVVRLDVADGARQQAPHRAVHRRRAAPPAPPRPCSPGARGRPWRLGGPVTRCPGRRRVWRAA